MTLYREEDREFAVGDRVQLTAPDRERHLANRELGTIEQMQAQGELHLRLDSDRTVVLNLREHHPPGHGYVVTSHNSQGQTADRVIVHIDLERVGEQLVNQRLAYVSISRGRDDAQINTNDKTQLAAALDRDASVETQFWGDRLGWVRDPEGHMWTIATRVEETSEDQRRERWSSILEKND